MLTRRHLCSALLGAFSGFGMRPSRAADYPDGPVRIVVPAVASGGTDILARIVARQLGERWRRPVTVENLPGASGGIAARAVMRSARDGRMLLMGSTGALMAAARGPDGSLAETFDVTQHLAPIILVAAPPYVVTINPVVPARTIEALISLARERAAAGVPLRYGTSGIGAASHLTAVLFERDAKVALTHVPLLGTGAAMEELLAGRIDLLFSPPQTVSGSIESGRLVGIATTGASRSPLFPTIPTVAEGGVAGFEAVGWFGLLASRGTPSDIVDRIAGDVALLLGDPTIRATLAELGAVPEPSSPEAFGRYINADVEKWTRLLKDAGATVPGGRQR